MSTFERWVPWWGLLVVPAAFLGTMSANYMIVPYACRVQHYALVHVAPAVQLAITVLGVVFSAWLVMRGRDAPVTVVPPERRFLNAISLAVAILFFVATLGQWYVAAALSPCIS
jgi:hypothetical protein